MARINCGQHHLSEQFDPSSAPRANILLVRSCTHCGGFTTPTAFSILAKAGPIGFFVALAAESRDGPTSDRRRHQQRRRIATINGGSKQSSPLPASICSYRAVMIP